MMARYCLIACFSIVYSVQACMWSPPADWTPGWVMPAVHIFGEASDCKLVDQKYHALLHILVERGYAQPSIAVFNENALQCYTLITQDKQLQNDLEQEFIRIENDHYAQFGLELSRSGLEDQRAVQVLSYLESWGCTVKRRWEKLKEDIVRLSPSPERAEGAWNYIRAWMEAHIKPAISRDIKNLYGMGEPAYDLSYLFYVEDPRSVALLHVFNQRIASTIDYPDIGSTFRYFLESIAQLGELKFVLCMAATQQRLDVESIWGLLMLSDHTRRGRDDYLVYVRTSREQIADDIATCMVHSAVYGVRHVQSSIDTQHLYATCKERAYRFLDRIEIWLQRLAEYKSISG